MPQGPSVARLEHIESSRTASVFLFIYIQVYLAGRAKTGGLWILRTDM